MGGLAHVIEGEGIATTHISLIREHTERMKPPRALAVKFELGRPFGAPNQPDFQRRVLHDCLGILECDSGPVIQDFLDLPPESENEDLQGWACPVNFAAPMEDISDADLVYQSLSQEINLLRPWYDEAVKNFNRSAFGISGKTTDEIVRFIADILVAPEIQKPPIPGENFGVGFKRMADDLRYFYTEAAIARPDQKTSDIEVANWLWGETTLGKVLVAIRDYSMESDDPSLKAMAVTAMVPTHQRHRTKHG